MPSRLTPEPEPEPKRTPESPQQLGVDSSERYDVYCTMRSGANMVYRNVRITRATPLFVPDDAYSKVGEFVELESTAGKLVFVSRMSIEAVCEQGIPLLAEPTSFKPSER